MTSIPNRRTRGPQSDPGRQTEPLLGLSFTERHPAFALLLTLLGLIVFGVTTGGALGQFAAELVEFALTLVSAEH